MDLLNIGCSRLGCGATERLQVDHRVEWSKIRVTGLVNLDWLCPHDHRLTTHVGEQRLTFGRVGKRLGIVDRTVVYYFPSKEELVSEVLLALGLQLQEMLEAAFVAPATDHLGLLRAAWPVLADERVDPMFALFFEANGLAATGLAPYDSLVPLLVEGWIAWVAEFLEGPEEERRIEAEATVAVIDGLLLLRLLAGADAADRAAHRLGVGSAPTG